MKTQVVNTISALLMLATMAACSFNGDSAADQNKVYLDDRSRIMAEYQPVVGTYEGEVTAKIRSSEDVNKFETRIIKVQIAVYTSDVQNGHDSNGQSTPLPVLNIRYRQLDVVRPDEILDARYVQASGKLTASNSVNSNGSNNSGNNGSSGGAGNNNSAVSICSSAGTISTALGDDTHVNGDTMTGSILRNNGLLGKFTARRTTRDVVAPLTDPATDCNDRLGQEYQQIAGYYEGTFVHSPENGGETVKTALTLSYVPMVTSNGLIAATLQGSFQYRKSNDPNLIPLTVGPMPAVFRAETVPAQLAMSYNVASTGGGFSMAGVLDGDTFTGEAYSSNSGHLGHIVVKKTARPPQN